LQERASEVVLKLPRRASFLPLFRAAEERVGERRLWLIREIPLSSILSPLLRHGARKKKNKV